MENRVVDEGPGSTGDQIGGGAGYVFFSGADRPVEAESQDTPRQ